MVDTNCERTPLKKQPKSLLESTVAVADTLPKPKALSWSTTDVSTWLQSIDLPQYVETFKLNFITGRRLLLLNPKQLCQLNIHDYDHQMRILREARSLFGVEMETFSRSISLPPRELETHFKLFNVETGRRHETMTRSNFFRDEMKILRKPKPELNHFERLHQYLQRQRFGSEVERELFGGVRRHHCCSFDL